MIDVIYNKNTGDIYTYSLEEQFTPDMLNNWSDTAYIEIAVLPDDSNTTVYKVNLDTKELYKVNGLLYRV